MKRTLSMATLVCLAVACGNKSSDTQSSTGENQPGDNGNNGSGGDGGSGPSGDLNKNPIEGIAPAEVILEAGEFTDGPVWHAGAGVLFFSTPLGEGGLYRMRPDGSTLKVRTGELATGKIPIGNAVDKAGNLINVEAKVLLRGDASPDAGAPAAVATGYPGEGGTAPFDTLNDAVVRADGTMYVTDPGYFGQPVANRLYRVTPQGQVQVVESFEDVPRPNGVALSPDQKMLYVGFSAPTKGTLPFIRRYYVNDDGTLGESSRFIDIAPDDSAPDGIEVDQAGNVYVAQKDGVAVYKADGSKIGVIAIPEQPTGSAFGDKDMQTLFITTQGVHIFKVHVNVPGVAQ